MSAAKQRWCVAAMAWGIGFASMAAEAADGFVAGVQPHRRPPVAPVITEVPKDARWYARALHGVDPPYPASLQFLESQGAWYTPFDRPGMTGPYDLRGWHRAPGAASR